MIARRLTTFLLLFTVAAALPASAAETAPPSPSVEEQWQEIPAAERALLLKEYRRFQGLGAEERARVLRNFRRWQSLSPK